MIPKFVCPRLEQIKLSLGEIIIKASIFLSTLLFFKKYFISLFKRKSKVPHGCSLTLVNNYKCSRLAFVIAFTAGASWVQSVLWGLALRIVLWHRRMKTLPCRVCLADVEGHGRQPGWEWDSGQEESRGTTLSALNAHVLRTVLKKDPQVLYCHHRVKVCTRSYQ